jgi:hypothetical protein
MMTKAERILLLFLAAKTIREEKSKSSKRLFMQLAQKVMEDDGLFETPAAPKKGKRK